VCSQVSCWIILDSVFCVSRAVSVQVIVGPGVVCDGCQGVVCDGCPGVVCDVSCGVIHYLHCWEERSLRVFENRVLRESIWG